MLLVVFAFGSVGTPAAAQELGDSREYLIKAAYLYQFSKYVVWPDRAFESADSPFKIGVYQENPFGDALDKIAAKKKVEKRSITISVIESPDAVANCHILFLPKTVQKDEVERVLRRANDADVLVIGESSNFVQLGGDVQFFLESNKVRFAFHDTAASANSLKVSSKLLALAKPAPVDAPAEISP